MGAPYSLRLAVESILREKWIYLVAALTIAVSLVFSALTVLLVSNIDTATKRLPERFSIMLFLDDAISPDERDALMSTVQKNSAVERITFIPKEQALQELKRTVKNADVILEGLGDNPLPDAIEVKLKKESVGPESVRRITDSLKGVKGIQEVAYGEEFLATINTLGKSVRNIGIVIVLLMAIGMLFVCYSTVKILFYRRDREIETYKLLGATKGFIRMPFLIEGAVIGCAGGILSFLTILGFSSLFLGRFQTAFPLLALFAFPVHLALIIPVAGTLIGIGGAAIAIGRIKY